MTDQTRTSRRGLLISLLTLPAAVLMIATAGPASAGGELNPSDRESFRFLQQDEKATSRSQDTRIFSLKEQAKSGGNRGVFSRHRAGDVPDAFYPYDAKRGFTIGKGR